MDIEDRDIAMFCYHVIDFVVERRIGCHDPRFEKLQTWHTSNRYDNPDVGRQAAIAFDLLSQWVETHTQFMKWLKGMQPRLIKSATDLYEVRDASRDQVMRTASERLLMVYLYLVGVDGHSYPRVEFQMEAVSVPMLERLSRLSGGPIHQLFAFNRKVVQAIAARQNKP